MNMEIQTVESILSAVSPAIRVPALLKSKKGRIIKPSYKDEFFPDGYGFEFEEELPKDLFEQYKNDIGQVRSAMFALCNKWGVVAGPLSYSLNIGTMFSRAQDEAIWHVDRSEHEDEYYTLLSPADSTVAKTWVSPIIHFLLAADLESEDSPHLKTLQAIRKNRETTGRITDEISMIANCINSILNTSLREKQRALRTKIEENSALVGGKYGWLLFSDPFVIHNGDLPTGEDRHIMTFDLARKRGKNEFSSIYDNLK